MTGVEIGARLRMGTDRKPRMATIVAVNGCGWGPCPNGDTCVTFRADGATTTENLPLDKAAARVVAS